MKKTATNHKRKSQSKPEAQKSILLLQSEGQTARKRQARALITPEEYMYVKHDLITIAIFTAVIIAGMIVLAFFIGIDM